MRILTGGVLAALVLVLVTPGAAHAGSAYHEQTSAYDGTADKSATASCPAGEKVIGSGGWIKDGFGRVALTGIVPSADLSSVTAYGRERSSLVGPWSVTAVAICGEGGDPERAYGAGTTTATATCPAGKILYSTGYRVVSPTGEPYVDEVVPSLALTRVDVHAGGGDAAVLAFGVCALPINNAERTHVTTDLDSSVSKEATSPKAFMHYDFGSWIFGAGVKATGAIVDGLGPNATLDGGRARAWRDTAGIKTSAGPMMLLGSEDWDMTVYATCIGSWY